MMLATPQAGFGMGMVQSDLVRMPERGSGLEDVINKGLVLGAGIALEMDPSTGGELHAGAAAMRPGACL